MRPKNIYKRLMTFVFIFSCVAIQSHGYEVKTHALMTENAFKNAIQTKDFLSTIGYSINDMLTRDSISQSILEWSKEGSVKEDETATSDVGGENFRYIHHFYDPVGNRGLDFNLAIVGQGYYHVTGNKAPDWALEDNGTFSKQFYSIQHAKKYYFAGLTASAKDEREANLAKTFKTLGQVLHVLQDMAQPQHTRNDPHGGDIFNTPYGPQMFGTKSQYELYVNAPKRINTFNYAAAYPVSFDLYRKFYVSADGKGMANFSNKNFVSAGTNFNCTLANCQGATGGGYVSPVLNVATQYDVAANQLEDVPTNVSGSVTFFKNTFTDNYSGQAITNDRMTTYSLFDRDLKNKGKAPAFTLNKENYQVMANLLLPRAVGYSAGLLNYFFRGDLEVIHVGNGIKVKNLSAETMTSYVDSATGRAIGDIQVYYDTTTNVRRLLKSCSLSASDCWQTPPVNLLPGGETEVFPFPLPTDNIKPNQYIVVFLGKLGNEEGAVIGRVDNSWSEEWDNGLKGNHPWLYTLTDYWQTGFYWNNDNNVVTDGRLIKENIRPQGSEETFVNGTLTKQSYKTGSSPPWYCIDEQHAMCLDYDFGKEFPIPITKNTWVRVKIDEMSINVDIPYQNCSPAVYGPGGYQGITLGFDNGNAFTFTVPGQVPIAVALRSYIEPGVEKAFNIFEAFKNAGVVFNEPVNLTGIEMQQALWVLCEPSIEEHRQKMVVDYIRLEER